MTLSTDVYVLDPIDPTEVFRYCQTLLGQFDEDDRGPDQQQTEVGESWRKDGSMTIQNSLGQNLPAWLMLHYRDGRPLVTDEESVAHDEDCNVPESEYFDPNEDECDGSWHTPACWINVDFDTAYGYKGPNGMGCGDLHAVLVAALGAKLDEAGVRWLWKNEYTGEIHDNTESLVELVTGGFEAKAWLENTVLPALMNRMS